MVTERRLWGRPKPGGSPSKPIRTPRLTGRPSLRRRWRETRGAEVGVGLDKKREEQTQEGHSRWEWHPWLGMTGTGRWPFGVPGGTTKGFLPGRAEGQEGE